MKVISRKESVVLQAKKAFRQTARALDDANKDAIAFPSYWEGFEGRTTYRQNGEVVHGAFRNIVDTANLSSSQYLSVDSFKATLTWDGQGVTPVVDVFFGYRTEFGYIPGRNWVDLALQNVDLANEFIIGFRGT